MNKIPGKQRLLCHLISLSAAGVLIGGMGAYAPVSLATPEIVAEAERGEDVAKGVYEEALKASLPQSAQMLVQQQAGVRGLEATQDPSIASLPAFNFSGYSGFEGIQDILPCSPEFSLQVFLFPLFHRLFIVAKGIIIPNMHLIIH